MCKECSGPTTGDIKSTSSLLQERGTNETRPRCRGLRLSTRNRKRTQTRHALEVTSGGHRRSRHVNGEGLAARRLSTGHVRPPRRSPLPLVWLMSVRSSQLLRADPLESPFGYAGSAESNFSRELRHEANMLLSRARPKRRVATTTASLSFLGMNYSLMWV